MDYFGRKPVDYSRANIDSIEALAGRLISRPLGASKIGILKEM